MGTEKREEFKKSDRLDSSSKAPLGEEKKIEAFPKSEPEEEPTEKKTEKTPLRGGAEPLVPPSAPTARGDKAHVEVPRE